MTISIVNSATNMRGPVRLLPFPYPYQAGLAISNDIDDATPELFIEIHRALNTTEETTMGEGLGLEITDSLWLWGGGVHLLDMQNKLTPQAEKLAELSHLGWIDTLHGMGDFNGRGGCTREESRVAYETLKQLDIKQRIFINHGDQHNSQNLYCRLAPEYRGDDPEAAEYHADLAYEYGIRWFWADELVSQPLSPALPDKSKQFTEKVKLHGKNLIKTVLGKARTRRKLISLVELAHPHELRDGNTLWNFTRYSNHPDGIWHRPGRHSFTHQLNEAFLNTLIKEKGWAILYTHFGQPEWQPGELLFDQNNWQALQKLADLHKQGKLLVAGTQRLLDIWRRQNYLQWDATESDDKIVINIQHIACPVEGDILLTVADCAGLAFESIKNKPIVMTVSGKEIQNLQLAEPDGRTRKHCYYLPWNPLQLPESFKL